MNFRNVTETFVNVAKQYQQDMAIAGEYYEKQGMYAQMHKNAPEGAFALAELRCNSEAYMMFDELIRRNWQKHNVFMGFAMDHGCHEIDGDCGSHGLDMPEDLNIRHYYQAYKANRE